MKIVLTISFLLTTVFVCAQTPGELLAEKVASKMKDSLMLNDNQKEQVYSINMQLYHQKQEVFVRYKSAADSLRFHIQKIENARDTLYSGVLPSEKFILYKQKKLNLLFNN